MPQNGHSAGTSASPERVAEVEAFLARAGRWASHRGDVAGLLLVGSYARNAARSDSDVDIILLTTDEARYLHSEAWVAELGLGPLVRAQVFGAIAERRHVTGSGLEIEIGIGSPTWAATSPVDPGTRRVVTDGARVLHDPSGLLDNLITACR